MKGLFFDNPKLNFIIFGGKGGSGKTTCACATALYLSQKYPEKKILVASTDPAPSIGDSLDLEVGNKITKIKDNLWAFEMDAFQLNKEYSAKYSRAIKILVERGTYLERSDIEEFSDKPFPGMDEVMAIMKIADFLREKKYDLVILDTAPTGHTKVLLSLPKAMARWLKVAKLMNKKHQFMMRRIRGKYLEDEVDQFLRNTAEDIDRINALLKDNETTEFVPVTIPESMSILETEGLIHDLEEMDIPVKGIICNRVIVSSECPFCNMRAKEKEKYLAMIEEKLKDYNLIKMPLFPTEIRGKESLNEYAKILFGKKKFEITLPGVLPKFPEIPEGKMADFLKKDLKFVISGGKGGVGKTTIAATTAIALAKKYRDKKILITTTDPAHALSNIFNQNIPLDTEPISIKGFDNLFALEIDTHKKLKEWENEYRQDVKDLFGKFIPKGIDIAYDREVLEELMELSPPGLEELMALRAVIDLMKEAKYDFYVLDSAASGHLLRFLELPNLIRDWLKSIFKILRKYQGLKLEVIAQKMVDFSRDVRKIQETLFNNPKTEFILITIAEEMGLQITADLAKSLEKLGVNYNYIVANFIVSEFPDWKSRQPFTLRAKGLDQIAALPRRPSPFDEKGCPKGDSAERSEAYLVNPASKCNFCLAKRIDQEKYLKQIKKQYPSKKLILVPLLPYDVRGAESLNEISKIIYG